MFTKLQELREEREQGFTLIELLVVILIIGVLAAIAIPMFLNQRKGAVDSTVESDVKNAATQVESWVVNQGATSTALPFHNQQISTDTSNADGSLSITVSEGNTLFFHGNSFGYCIVGTNPGGDKSNFAAGQKEEGIIYASLAGGIQDELTGSQECSNGQITGTP